MNTRGEEDECFLYKCFSAFRNCKNNVRTFLINQYLRIKNLNQEIDSIFNSSDGNYSGVKNKSIRVVLGLTTSLGLEVDLMDVKMAFLHVVYMNKCTLSIRIDSGKREKKIMFSN